jgi:hypothetical protein
VATTFYHHTHYDPVSAGVLLREADLRMDRARRAAAVMPRLDKDGRSDCPFYDRLRDQLGEALDDLCQCTGYLHEHLAGANTEIRRCQVNRDRVLQDLKKLYGTQPRSEYAKAAKAVGAECAIHTNMRNQIQRKIQAVEGLLAAASIKVGPGKKPSGRFHFLPPAVPLTSPAQPFRQGPRSTAEVERLIGIDSQRLRGPIPRASSLLNGPLR